ncbi:DUF3365 domain-containing protein [Mariprofundus erugo]|uniref:Tll0287-like domain-containing protein n=1 Tax=Mariprofundus erugo TaxID=2528639 RepID=UPI0010FE0554|nr:DUF3365 domain-containing protein [Mariprofundus erugo]TLS78191.1 DUF3365 domain-containing protein [Mariprofundus erugo]
MIVRRYFLAIASAWSLLFVGLICFAVMGATERENSILLAQARPFFNQIIITRAWNAGHGGVYVPITAANPPNPYLHVPDRDLETTSGMKLTLINPAYMTRQIAEISRQKNSVNFHLTSDHPIRPENRASAWEHDALAGFSAAGDEYYDRWQDNEGRPFFRYMAPVWMSKACIQCHTGKHEGDMGGGLSVILPAESVIASEQASIWFNSKSYAVIWLLGLAGLVFAYREIRQRASEQERLIERLENTLQGLVPICASCKNIRNDDGEWEQLEIYLTTHSDAEFSHGICPECHDKLYGGFVRSNRDKKQ